MIPMWLSLGVVRPSLKMMRPWPEGFKSSTLGAQQSWNSPFYLTDVPTVPAWQVELTRVVPILRGARIILPAMHQSQVLHEVRIRTTLISQDVQRLPRVGKTFTGWLL